MIALHSRAQVLVFREPVDMRKQYEGLFNLASTVLGRKVFDGDIFVFIGRTRKRVKLLWWDGTGLCILAKRLTRGRFIAPWLHKGEGALTLSRTELALLVEGCDLVGTTPLSPPPWSPGC